jgi:hypothetical protein
MLASKVGHPEMVTKKNVVRIGEIMGFDFSPYS